MKGAAYNLGLSTQATETDLPDLPVQGKVPPWLSGMLIRTAPAKYEVAGDTYQHWFDGLAMLHRFDFANGHVSYSSRFRHSCAYREALQKRRISRPEFATTPRFTWLERVAHWIHPLLTDNCNVSVNKLGDHIVVFTETPRPIRLDAQTLTERGHYSYGEHVRGALSIAHPHGLRAPLPLHVRVGIRQSEPISRRAHRCAHRPAEHPHQHRSQNASIHSYHRHERTTPRAR